MQNDEKKPVEDQAQDRQEPVSAELLEEEYQKRSILTSDLKKTHGEGKKLGLKIVGAVLAVALIVGGFLLSRSLNSQDGTEAQPTAQPTEDLRVAVLDRNVSDVDYVTVTLPGEESYTISSHAVFDDKGQLTGAEDGAENPFEVKGQPDFSLNSTQVLSLVRYSAAMTANRMVAENVKDYSEYGLDDPACRAEIHYKNGSVTTLAFGDPVPTTNDAYYYMTVEGTGKVYMVYSLHYRTFHATLNSWHTVPTNTGMTDSNAVDKLFVQRPGQEPLEIVHKEDSDDFLNFTGVKLVQPFENEASAERVSELFEAAIGISLSSYAGSLAEMAEDAALTEDARTTVKVTDNDGNELLYYVGRVADDGDHTYVAIDDTSVYLANTSSVEFIGKCTPQYVIDQFSGIVYIARMDSVTVETGEDSYELSVTRTTVDDKVQEEYFFDGEPVEDKLFKKLYQEVIGSLVSKVSDDFYLTGDTVLKITYHLNVQPGEYVIEFITYDDDYYAVRRADGLTVYLIKQDRVTAIADAMASMRRGEFTGE